VKRSGLSTGRYACQRATSRRAPSTLRVVVPGSCRPQVCEPKGPSLRADERRIKWTLLGRCLTDTSELSNRKRRFGGQTPEQSYETCSNLSWSSRNFCQCRAFAGESYKIRSCPPASTVWPAPVGHRQPRMNDLPPDVVHRETHPGEAVTGQRRQLDSRLTICRGC
jgi:hypothetical protein